jgi:hypothetical protein
VQSEPIVAFPYSTEGFILLAGTCRSTVQMECIVGFHGSSGYENAPQYYVCYTRRPKLSFLLKSLPALPVFYYTPSISASSDAKFFAPHLVLDED